MGTKKSGCSLFDKSEIVGRKKVGVQFFKELRVKKKLCNKKSKVTNNSKSFIKFVLIFIFLFMRTDRQTDTQTHTKKAGLCGENKPLGTI